MKKTFKKLGHTGRMISGSKSVYCFQYPTHEVYFNANIIVNGKKEWHGDIDLTIDRPILEEIATDLQQSLFILSEMDARFENENLSKEEFEKRARAVIHPKDGE
jgi:hypothetical protein